MLPFYTHPNSPKMFTQHQLFACLVLKNFSRPTIEAWSRTWLIIRGCCEVLRLKRCRTSRPCKRPVGTCWLPRRAACWKARFDCTTAAVGASQSGAMDSTGLECTAASGYFVRRRNRVALPWKTIVYHHFPKLGVVCDTSCHFVLVDSVGRGPRPMLTSSCRC